MSWRIHQGDWLEVLRTMPDCSVHCVVTSPPYWGLRDYGVAGQLGLERTPEEYVARMVDGFREVRRVLRPDGVVWLNLGDTYHQGCKGNSGEITDPKCKQATNIGSQSTRRGVALGPNRTQRLAGIKPKDLVGIPWMVAFALRADGWYLRAENIWSKKNAMPESVADRPTRAHEQVFLLTKSARYFYDADAIREPFAEATLPRAERANTGTAAPGQSPHSGICGPRLPAYYKGSLPGRKDGPGQDRRSKNDRSDVRTRVDLNANWDSAEESGNLGAGANKRSVWSIATHPFPDAHFATFPPEIPEICIKAGCPEGGTVLDPFCGAGTTGMVAKRLMRSFVGIELNPQYVEMARRRIVDDAPLFNSLSEPTQEAAPCAD